MPEDMTRIVIITTTELDQVGPEPGPLISGDFPVAMAELLAAAERGVTGADTR